MPNSSVSIIKPNLAECFGRNWKKAHGAGGGPPPPPPPHKYKFKEKKKKKEKKNLKLYSSKKIKLHS